MGRPTEHYMWAPDERTFDAGLARCVVCNEDAEYLMDYLNVDGKQLVKLTPGELVYWEVRLPREGVVDETFAPTMRDAQQHARTIHGIHAEVRLIIDRLPIFEDGPDFRTAE